MWKTLEVEKFNWRALQSFILTNWISPLENSVIFHVHEVESLPGELHNVSFPRRKKV